jgi:hypothetical protein
MARAHIWCLLHLGRWVEAEDACDRVLAVDPCNVAVLLYKVCSRPRVFPGERGTCQSMSIACQLRSWGIAYRARPYWG